MTNGQDIIINSLGNSVSNGGIGGDVCSKGTEVILKAMKENNVKKIITCSSLGVGDSY